MCACQLCWALIGYRANVRSGCHFLSSQTSARFGAETSWQNRAFLEMYHEPDSFLCGALRGELGAAFPSQIRSLDSHQFKAPLRASQPQQNL